MNRVGAKRIMAGVLIAFTMTMAGYVVRVQAAPAKHLVPVALHAQILATCPNNALHCAQLTWTASVVDATHTAPTGYKLYRTTVSGGCAVVTAIGCTNAGATTASPFVDAPLAGSTTYFWVTTGVNTAGESGPSNQATATTPADPVSPPNPPTNLQVAQTK